MSAFISMSSFLARNAQGLAPFLNRDVVAQPLQPDYALDSESYAAILSAAAPAAAAPQPGPLQPIPSPVPSSAAAFTGGNIVIYRVGTGAAALSSAATAVFLDEYTPAGTLVQSIALPTADSGANQTLTASGSATSEGLLNRSTDGRYLILTGYDTAIGTANVATTGSTVRVVGRVDASGNVDTTTALTNLGSNNIRSAVSTDGSAFWLSSAATGVNYATLGATTATQISTTVTTVRHVDIFDGQLYVTSSSGTTRIATVGSGLPTTAGQTITNIPGSPTTGSPYAFFYADLSAAVAGVDTLYVADDGLGLQKYTLTAGNWVLDGTITASGIRGLEARVSGTTVTLFITSQTTLFTFTDTSGYDGTLAGSLTTLATAATNTAFRGVAFAPEAPPVTPTLSINDVTAAEGDSGTTNFTFTVTLSSAAPAGGVTFDIATADGTALAGSDYTARLLTAQVIPQGSLTYTFTVTVNGDTTVEPNETFFVNVTNVSGATVADGQGLGTITNDDTVAPQTVEFAASSVAVSRIEPDAGTVTYTFTVSRGAATTGTMTVNGTIAAGTTDAADFGGTLPTAFTATIADGASTGTFTVTVSGDDAIEADESFNLTITGGTVSNGATVSVGTNALSTATILNDDAGPTIGGITVYDQAPSLAGAATTPTATDDVVLVRLGAYAGTGTTAAGRSESVAFDGTTDRIFSTNNAQGRIDVTQLNADASTTALTSISLTGLTAYGTVNSVAVSGGVIAVAYDNVTAGQPGYVALFDVATQTLQASIQVGVVPDQLTFTPDGTRLIVANEGEAISSTNNPAGSISIISLAGGAASATVTNTIGFSGLTGFETELTARGVAVLGSQAAGNDVEPEYITVSPDGTRAYVTLQEVNAVAVIDLTNPSATTPLAILPLGGVDHNLAGNAFDPSDVGATISIGTYNAIGLLQPDAIASYTVGGVTYFVTANEGDSRVGTGISDTVRLNSASYVLDPTAYPNAAALKADAVLGRLNVLTNIGDTDGDGDFDQIYTIGGRGFSIFRQNADGSFTKVRESGGEFEAIIARDFPTLFNVNQNLSPIDARSDDKGPEPEGVSIGQVGSRIYAFISLERVGGVMTYDITDPANAFYVGFRPVTSQDFGPETSRFVTAADSPTGGALLLTANEVSGTTTVYRVVAQTEGNDTIDGGPDADTFNARGGDDVIRGLAGNDTLNGGAGADDITGGAGNDAIDGGSDTDLARFTGNRADYSISLNGSTYTIVDNRGGSPDGTDTVTNVENFAFADGTIAAADLINTGTAGSVSIAGASIVEGNSGTSTLLLTLTRTGGGAAFSVTYDTADVTATAGSDYVAVTGGTATFGLGVNQVTIPITINGDIAIEPDETFTVSLSAPTNGATLGTASATGTITNDDFAGTLSIGNATVVEGNAGTTPIAFTVSRSGGTTGAVSATWTVGLANGAGNASAADFASGQALTGTVNFADGQTQATITLNIQGDVSVEPDELFIVTLSNPTGGASLGTTTGIGTITNDDVATLSISDPIVNEGNAGTTVLTYIVTASDPAPAGGISFDIATADGTATAGSDYVARSVTAATIAAGSTTYSFDVTVNGDTTYETNETVLVTLTNATGATIADAQGVGTITNDDAGTGTFRIFATNFTGFTAAGFAPNPTATQLDSDVWRVVGLSDITNPAYGFTATTGDFARGVINGSADPTTAGVYSPSSNAALVVQPTGAELDVGGFIEARILNNTGATATSFNIAFDWAYRNSAARASNLQLSYSTDGTNFTVASAANFTTPGTAEATTPAVFSYQNEVLTLSNLAVADGGNLYLRWTHLNSTGSGSRDEVGIDNITVDAVTSTQASFAIANTSVVEGDTGTTTALFTVTRSSGNGVASIDFATANGTATAGSDYVATSGTLNFADGQTQATIAVTVNGDTLFEPNETFFVNLSNPVGALLPASQAVGTITNDDSGAIRIYDIQGSGLQSSYVGLTVTTTGIVTAVDTNGYYIQDATGDGNAATSDGIFVFTSTTAPTVSVGQSVSVTGTVAEFQTSAGTGLTVTEITSPTVTVLSSGNALPGPVLIGTGGILPPNSSYPAAIAFYEALEGMRVTIDTPLVVSNTNSFGETYVVASGGAGATSISASGGITISPGDLNPERIQIDDDSGIFAGYTPAHTIGDRLSNVTGIFNYAFNNYELLVTEAVTTTTDRSFADDTAQFAGDLTHITIATYNLENYDPLDGKDAALATDILFNLRAPDIIGVQEIQDADGAGTGTNLSGQTTANGLINAIIAAGGPTYAYVEVAPTTANSTGGEPNGNIRNGYFYRTDRVQYVANSAVLINDAAYNGSRRPLVADFVFNGQTIQLINMHSTSRGGSDPLFGVNQPPNDAGDAARTAQATATRAYVNNALATNPNLNIAVLGDFNGFYFENALQTLTAGGVLTNLNSLLPVEERYSYLFDGNLQQLDNIMVTGGLVQGARYDAVHLNAESTLATRPTDHDPQVAYLFLAPIFNGTANDDTFTASSAVPYTIYGNDGNDTLTGNSQADVIFGGLGNDILDGAGGNDSIAGGAGNDTLIGGAGNNELQGGDGDDLYIVSSATDSIIEAANAGTDTVQTGLASYALGANVENLTFTGAIAHAGTGNDLGNVLTGSTGFDALSGGAGNDRLVGGSGAANELQGGTGDDVYVVTAVGDSIIENAGEGTDTVETSVTPFTLAANVENLTYTGSGDFSGIGNGIDNIITGGLGRDSLFGGAGNDTLIGGDGAANELQGGTGNDTYVVTATGDTVLELVGEGTDTVGTSLAVFTLPDNVENLVYSGTGSFSGIGNAANNQITGGAGADTLVGNDGADTLVGGAGADLLIGGNGADNFAYTGTEGANYDRILDFTSGSDRILLANSGFARTATLDFVSGAGAAATSANSTFLYDTNTGIVSYDADGTGAGAAVALAQLNTGLTLTVSDFAFF